jgi:hypothetical protein
MHDPNDPYLNPADSLSGLDSTLNDTLRGADSLAFHSDNDSFQPYTTIADDGWIYQHNSSSDDGHWVGTVHDGVVHNTRDDYLGYAGNDGKVYDDHDHCIGWLDSHDGSVYNSAGLKVYETTKGVAGAAAYLLCVYHGNVD